MTQTHGGQCEWFLVCVTTPCLLDSCKLTMMLVRLHATRGHK